MNSAREAPPRRESSVVQPHPPVSSCPASLDDSLPLVCPRLVSLPAFVPVVVAALVVPSASPLESGAPPELVSAARPTSGTSSIADASVSGCASP